MKPISPKPAAFQFGYIPNVQPNIQILEVWVPKDAAEPLSFTLIPIVGWRCDTDLSESPERDYVALGTPVAAAMVDFAGNGWCLHDVDSGRCWMHELAWDTVGEAMADIAFEVREAREKRERTLDRYRRAVPEAQP